MNRRLPIGVAALALLLVTAGCLGGTPSVSNGRLDAAPDGSYAWAAETDAHITVQGNDRFRAVYEVNNSSVELYRFDSFSSRTPLSVKAVRYRYDDGTVLSGIELEAHGDDVMQDDRTTNVMLPENAGRDRKLTFSSSSTPRRFSLSVFVEGSYGVVLSVDRRVDLPIFGSVRPSGYDAEVVDDRLHIRWDEVTDGNAVVQFYLQRDLDIFAAVAVVSMLVDGAGILYYRRQIRTLRDRRRGLGLGVEDDGR